MINCCRGCRMQFAAKFERTSASKAGSKINKTILSCEMAVVNLLPTWIKGIKKKSKSKEVKFSLLSRTSYMWAILKI